MIHNIGGAPVQQPKLNLSLATTIKCERCEGTVFISAYIMKQISALQSPTGQTAIIPIETYSCIGCGHINKMFNPTHDDETTEGNTPSPLVSL